MTRVLVTGARGFVGSSLIPVLARAGCDISAVCRTTSDANNEQLDNPVRLDIDGNTDWHEHLNGVDAVVHLAGLAHSTSELHNLALYRKENVASTQNLAKQAAASGVRRLVFVSSIKVNGGSTGSRAFRFDDRPSPVGAYAVSKKEAEDELRVIEVDSNLEVVIIRPPLVYGPGLKGNLASLMNLIDRGVPIPTGKIENRRDLISIYNLCDLVRVCITHPDAPGHTFLASDGDPVSTNELIRRMASGAGKDARIWSVPIGALKLVASLAGKAEQLAKLSSSLQIDMTETQSILNWQPPYSVAKSFEMTFADDGG
jgi:nucleoside-diphosphate-sugar epimerase